MRERGYDGQRFRFILIWLFCGFALIYSTARERGLLPSVQWPKPAPRPVLTQKPPIQSAPDQSTWETQLATLIVAERLSDAAEKKIRLDFRSKLDQLSGALDRQPAERIGDCILITDFLERADYLDRVTRFYTFPGCEISQAFIQAHNALILMESRGY